MTDIVINVTENVNDININNVETIEQIDIIVSPVINTITVNSIESSDDINIDVTETVDNVTINVIGTDYTKPASKLPTFIYTSGILDRINYASDNSYKTFSYISGLLVQTNHYLSQYTLTKDFSYNSDQLLININETII